MYVYDLCRICLTEDINKSTMQPLFDDEDSCAEIVQRIELCGGIVLKEHEGFPKMICTQCLEKLNVSFKFRSMCQKSEHALLDAIAKSEIKSEPQDYDNAQIISNDDDNDDNEMFFDMPTKFNDAQEINLEDITEMVKEEVTESDMEPKIESAEEFIGYTDSEYFKEIGEDKVNEETTKLHIKKEPLTGQDSFRKREREKANTSIPIKSKLHRGKNSKRGRKKKVELEMCKICGNQYKHHLLKRHMRRHMTENPVKCEICGKTFASPSEIGRHMRVHTGEKPFVCRFCGRRFGDRSTKIKHERIHTNERPFSCQTCGKSFTYSNVLKNHMLTHTGEKPFPCIPCNKTFSRKHQLDKHIVSKTHQHTVGNLAAADLKEQLHQVQPNQHITTISHQQSVRQPKVTNAKVKLKRKST